MSRFFSSNDGEKICVDNQWVKIPQVLLQHDNLRLVFNGSLIIERMTTNAMSEKIWTKITSITPEPYNTLPNLADEELVVLLVRGVLNAVSAAQQS